MIGKIIKNFDHYELVQLDDLEIIETLRDVTGFNVANFRSILITLQKYLKEVGIKLTPSQIVTVSLALFQKCGITSYAALSTELSRKISSAKAEARANRENNESSAYEVQKPEGSVEEQ